MPSARRISEEPGFAPRARSSRAIGGSAARCAYAGAPVLARSSSAARDSREARPFMALLSIRIEHVLEAKPVSIKIEVGVARGTVAVLDDQQFGCAFDPVPGLVHLLAEHTEDDVGLVCDGAPSAKVLEPGAKVLPRAIQRGKLRGDDDRHLELHSQSLQPSDSRGSLFLERPVAMPETFQRVDDSEFGGAVVLDRRHDRVD